MSETVSEAKKYVNGLQFSAALHVHYQTIYNWHRKGLLPGAKKDKISGQIQIPLKTANELLESRGISLRLS